MGPDPGKLREIARSVEEIMRNDPNMRTVNVDWGEHVPKLHFVLGENSRNENLCTLRRGLLYFWESKRPKTSRGDSLVGVPHIVSS